MSFFPGEPRNLGSPSVQGEFCVRMVLLFMLVEIFSFAPSCPLHSPCGVRPLPLFSNLSPSTFDGHFRCRTGYWCLICFRSMSVILFYDRQVPLLFRCPFHTPRFSSREEAFKNHFIAPLDCVFSSSCRRHCLPPPSLSRATFPRVSVLRSFFFDLSPPPTLIFLLGNREVSRFSVMFFFFFPVSFPRVFSSL